MKQDPWTQTFVDAVFLFLKTQMQPPLEMKGRHILKHVDEQHEVRKLL